VPDCDPEASTSAQALRQQLRHAVRYILEHWSGRPSIARRPMLGWVLLLQERGSVMKICFVSHEYEPFYGGGIATYHNAAARQLAEAGHTVHVVTNAARYGREEPRFSERRWQDGNLTVHRLPYFDDCGEAPKGFTFNGVGPGISPRDADSWAAHISNQTAYAAANYIELLNEEIGLDVIEAPEYFAEIFYVLRRRFFRPRRDRPVVCVHGHTSTRVALRSNGDLWGLGDYPRRQMMDREEYCIQEADGLITPSRAMMRRYQLQFSRSLPRVRDVIPLFLDLPTALGALPSGLDKGQYIAVVGRIEGRKGTDTAIRAFAKLAETHPALRLVLVGNDSWRPGQSVDDMIASHLPSKHRDRVLRTGRVPRDVALRIVRDARLVIHPSLWDNYPYAVMEAMALGTLCVVSDAGGHTELIEHGATGLVFSAGNEAELASAIISLLQPSTRTDRLRDAARNRIEETTSTPRLVDMKLRHYERAIRSSRLRARALVGPGEGSRSRSLIPTRSEKDGRTRRGLALIDCLGASPHAVETTLTSLRSELGSSDSWRIEALSESSVHNRGFSEGNTSMSRVPSLDAADEVLLYVLAGVVFEIGAIPALVGQVFGSRTKCGSFAWLRPTGGEAFPYPPDLNANDLFRIGRVLPAAVAVRAEHARAFSLHSGLMRPAERVAALMRAAWRKDVPYRHPGILLGDFLGPLPTLDVEGYQRLIGYADLLGLSACN
jgi:glycosyltransferase involved in cell wall biosynthesis